VAEMIYYTFKRESNDFKDMLSDVTIKKEIDTQMAWHQHITLGFRDDVPQKTLGYLVIKYGDEITNPFEFDYSPVENVDYIPKGIHIQIP
jgi:hypothetical protein